MMVSNRNLLFQGSIFRFYVSFREGKQSLGVKIGDKHLKFIIETSVYIYIYHSVDCLGQLQYSYYCCCFFLKKIYIYMYIKTYAYYYIQYHHHCKYHHLFLVFSNKSPITLAPKKSTPTLPLLCSPNPCSFRQGCKSLCCHGVMGWCLIKWISPKPWWKKTPPKKAHYGRLT